MIPNCVKIEQLQRPDWFGRNHPNMTLKIVSLTTAALVAFTLPTFAEDWHDHHRSSHRGSYRSSHCGSRVSVGIGLYSSPYYSPYYYGGRPAYYPYYYEPAPVVVSRPVVVGREVGGDLAVDAQRALARKGYYRGVIDGDLGPRSRAAIREWQADCRLPVTGQLDAATLRSLALL
ncbi:MAG: peptidoglycan-binding domain-containing protein [Verrucomicrobia bacterium]|nr:peptidoglycan-binding domain-containing protein [Verrucomicrobiota bacterium]